MTVSSAERSGNRSSNSETTQPTRRLRPSRRPRRSHRRSRRGRHTAVIIGAGALLLVLAGAAGVRFLSHEIFGPKAQVEVYLGALVSGDQTAAVELLPPSPALTPQDPEIYAAAGDRITGYEVLGQEINGGKALIRTEVEVNGEKTAVEFALLAEGRRFLAFTNWQLTHTAARTVAVTVPAGTGELRINGREVPLPADRGGTLDVRLLPGGYTVQGPDNRYLSYGSPQPVLVEPGMSGDPEPVRLFASATAELAADVQAKGEAYLEACLDRKETAPEACPNAAYTSGDPASYRNPEWTLEKPPVYRLTGTPATGLAVFATGGKARVSYEEDATENGHWEARSDLVNIPFGSELELVGEDLLLDFRP